MRPITTLALLLIGSNVALAQPQIEWQRTFGGTLDDTGASAEQTSDGGFIVCGTTYSNNGDVSGNHGNGDIWLVKLDAQGVIQWQRALGGSQGDGGRWAGELPGIGYLVLGGSRSNDGDVSGNHGMSDIWLAKVDMAGEPIWQRSYGGSLNDAAFGINATPDGGWIIAGGSSSSDGDVTANAGYNDYWVLKIDADGNIQWERSYGGSGGDNAYDIALTSDGGYILNGYSSSTDGDVSGAHGGGDYWVVRIDATGNIIWQRACGGSSVDYGFSVIELANGNILAFGESGSADGDVIGPNGSSDYWMAELSSAGVLVGNAAYGGSATDRGRNFLPMIADGFLLAGASASSDGDVLGNSGSFDSWLVRTDGNGAILWQLVLGGTQGDGLGQPTAVSTGGFLVIGGSYSSDGDLPGNQGGEDIWVVKLGPDPVGVSERALQQQFLLYPNPANTECTLLSNNASQGPAPWKILDRAGRSILAGRCAAAPCRIDVRILEVGAYTVLIDDAGRKQALPFVKQ